MKIEPRVVGRERELPPVEPGPPAVADELGGEVLRLLAPEGSVEAARATATVLDTLPLPEPAAFSALAAVLPSLLGEERDHRALEALDPEGRAALAPRLAAVRIMAETVSMLLSLRDEAAVRRRSVSEA